MPDKKRPLLFHNGLNFLNGHYETLRQCFTASSTFPLIRRSPHTPFVGSMCPVQFCYWAVRGRPQFPETQKAFDRAQRQQDHWVALSSRANLCCLGLKQLFYIINTCRSHRALPPHRHHIWPQPPLDIYYSVEVIESSFNYCEPGGHWGFQANAIIQCAGPKPWHMNNTNL